MSLLLVRSATDAAVAFSAAAAPSSNSSCLFQESEEDANYVELLTLLEGKVGYSFRSCKPQLYHLPDLFNYS